VTLNGTYVYVFSDKGLKKLIFGTFNIVHNMDTLRLASGRCWYGGTTNPSIQNQRGTLTNKGIGLEDYLWVPYSMDITTPVDGHEESSYHGVMRLQKQECPALKGLYLTGSLRDHDSQILHHGRLQACRISKKDMQRMNDFKNIPEMISKYLDICVNSKESSDLSNQRKAVEQAGTGQPAIRPESKSEGGDKPQPEAEGRPR
jgi:hypothetical protein